MNNFKKKPFVLLDNPIFLKTDWLEVFCTICKIQHLFQNSYFIIVAGNDLVKKQSCYWHHPKESHFKKCKLISRL